MCRSLRVLQNCKNKNWYLCALVCKLLCNLLSINENLNSLNGETVNHLINELLETTGTKKSEAQSSVDIARAFTKQNRQRIVFCQAQMWKTNSHNIVKFKKSFANRKKLNYTFLLILSKSSSVLNFEIRNACVIFYGQICFIFSCLNALDEAWLIK